MPREGRPTLVRRRAQAVQRDARAARRIRRHRRAGSARRASWRGSARAGARVAFDAATAPARLTQALEAAGGAAILGADPIALMKAVKNKAELAGARAAHIRDGAAMARFLAWFDREAPKGRLTEIDAARGAGDVPARDGRAEGRLVSHHRRRRAARGDPPLSRQRGLEPQDRPRDLPHRQRRPIRGRHDRHHPHDLPSAGRRAEMRDRFTRVLKGHIAIARAIFPQGDERRADRRVGAPGAVARRARFRSRHGPRRRLVSLGPRRPAAHRQDRDGRRWRRA